LKDLPMNSPKPIACNLRPGLLLASAAVLLAGCAAPAPAVDVDALAAKMMASSFRDQGIAKVDRLQQDAANAACSKAQGGGLPAAQSQAIEADALRSIKQPTDGKYLGDWREGEKIAQNGRGMTWTDPSAATSANGGNCYNCHQISPAEISFGPSLYQYGKLRGVTDPASAASKPIVDYTWNKLWNAKAYNACSGMPRFGHAKLLDEAQLKHLMALILDPNSPVNR
jgi:L-cysteine S-thiosulfotransferase